MFLAFAASLGGRTLFKSSLAFPLVAVFVASLLYDGGQVLLLQGMGWDLSLGQAMWRTALPTAILNTVLAPVFYLFLQGLDRRTRRAGEPEW
jgi:cell shape-determining protein MreD